MVTMHDLMDAQYDFDTRKDGISFLVFLSH